MFIEVLFQYKGNEQLSLVSAKLHYIHFQGVLQNAILFFFMNIVYFVPSCFPYIRISI